MGDVLVFLVADDNMIGGRGERELGESKRSEGISRQMDVLPKALMRGIRNLSSWRDMAERQNHEATLDDRIYN